MNANNGLWPALWSHAEDPSGIILCQLSRKDKEGLRGARSDSRTVTNATVSKAVISERNDLTTLPKLKLSERFPNLRSVALKDDEANCVVTCITDFALATLAKLPSLSSVDLASCKALPPTAAAQALTLVPQLQQLTMMKGARFTNGTLQFLGTLTNLTSLDISNSTGYDQHGLQQLGSLLQLRSLACNDCKTIKDDCLRSIGLLQKLTSLQLRATSITGATLGQLEGLHELVSLDLDICRRLTSLRNIEKLCALQQLKVPSAMIPEPHWKHLSALTNLTSLTADILITEDLSGILDLPDLANLEVHGIILQNYDADRCSNLTSLALRMVDTLLANFLPLRKLARLIVESEFEVEDEFITALASQTTLTSLDIRSVFGLEDRHVMQLSSQLRLLCSLALTCSDDCGIDTLKAIVALPQLQELQLDCVPQPLPLALLHQCRHLSSLTLWFCDGADTVLLSSFVCKPGMQRVCYLLCGEVDEGVLLDLAVECGVVVEKVAI